MKPLPFGGDDMFVIVVYDVESSRCEDMRKYLTRWLEHRQRSVFSGFLSRSQLTHMKHGLKNRIDNSYDSVIIFQSNRANQVGIWQTGRAAEAHTSSMVVPSEEDRKAARKKKQKTGKKKNYRL